MANRRIITNTLPNAFPNVQPAWNAKPQKITKTFKPKSAGTNGTHCFLILDESGSMASFRNDTIGGVNTYIDKQKEDNDGTKITIVNFEGGNIRIPVDGLEADKIGNFSDYRPLGGTNLLDAVGFTLNKINDLLSNLKKKERPSIFIQIVTDGAENASKNYIKEEIQGMIASATDADWIVSYVGANVDAFAEANKLGINAAAVSNYTTTKLGDVYHSMAASTTRMKSMRNLGMNAAQMYDSNAIYTSVERDSMEEK